MSLLVEFTEKDIKRSTILEPGWYKFRIGEPEAKMAKDQKSTNINIEMIALCNADTGDEECSGVPVFQMFNSKRNDFVIGFANALNDDDDEIVKGSRFDFEAAAGKEVEAFIGNRTYEGQIQNDMKHQYRKVGAGA